MDGWMENYAKITEEYFADSKNQLGKFNYDPNYPGCGAAGGLGFAFRTFLHGKLEPGISIVLEEIGIENQIKNSLITAPPIFYRCVSSFRGCFPISG